MSENWIDDEIARHTERLKEQDGKFILVSEHQERTTGAWWGGFIWGGIAVFAACLLSIVAAHAQTVPPPSPAPSSYTFTVAPDEALSMLQSLERVNQLQALVTGERSARFDELERKLRQSAADQEKAVADAAKVKSKEEPKAKQKEEAKP